MWEACQLGVSIYQHVWVCECVHVCMHACMWPLRGVHTYMYVCMYVCLASVNFDVCLCIVISSSALHVLYRQLHTVSMYSVCYGHSSLGLLACIYAVYIYVPFSCVSYIHMYMHLHTCIYVLTYYACIYVCMYVHTYICTRYIFWDRCTPTVPPPPLMVPRWH